MSAFLGPIHYWLYNKIQFQENLTKAILKEGWFSQENLDKVCQSADLRPLEEVIDQGNIHGWLQNKIGIVETRFAFLVTQVLKDEPSRLERLEEIAFEFGRENPIEKGTDASLAFRAFEDRLLNGMPCDHVNMALETSKESVVWKQARCIHSQHWENVGGDVSLYYRLRKKIIEGMVSGSGLEFYDRGNDQFEIRRA